MLESELLIPVQKSLLTKIVILLRHLIYKKTVSIFEKKTLNYLIIVIQKEFSK